MRTFVKAVILSLGLATFGNAQALNGGGVKPHFSVPKLSKDQMKAARADIRQMVPGVKSIKFGFDPRPGMIGEGAHKAWATLKNGQQIEFTVAADIDGKITVEK
jgi:hypothetical protein